MIYICIYIHAYMHIYMYIYIHTYIHTYIDTIHRHIYIFKRHLCEGALCIYTRSTLAQCPIHQ